MSATPDRGERRHAKEDAARQYPEHEKLKAVQEESQAIGEFLEFGGYTLCEISDAHPDAFPWAPVRKSINDILAEYFCIDQKKLEEEKRAMLESMRDISRPVVGNQP